MAKTSAFRPEPRRFNESTKAESEQAWNRSPELVRRFIDRAPAYEKLCSEIAYTLDRALVRSGVDFASIVYRAKSLDSFLEKIRRKSYVDPFTGVTDFAGVRVVYLYADDLPKLETVLTESFEILEKIDKSNEPREDRFGYGAVHFLVRLGEDFVGPRYDDLKGLLCEVQARTVLQDAWAVIDDHLVYKGESQIPKFLRRRLNSLAASFERADSEFKNIRSERKAYLAEIERSTVDLDSFLENELNLDSFVRYSEWKFPDLPSGAEIVDVPFFLRPISEMGLTSLADLDGVVDRANPVYEAYVERNGRDFLAGYSITSTALSALLINREHTPPHIRQIFPSFAAFLESD